MSTFQHEAARLTDEKPIVYTALSKHLFYYRIFIVKYVLELGKIPINPFMSFDYFLLDTIDRNLVRTANNNLVRRSDELWVFGAISNGVLVEIELAHSLNKPVRYFRIAKPHEIVPSTKEEMDMEEDIKKFRSKL